MNSTQMNLLARLTGMTPEDLTDLALDNLFVLIVAGVGRMPDFDAEMAMSLLQFPAPRIDVEEPGKDEAPPTPPETVKAAVPLSLAPDVPVAPQPKTKPPPVLHKDVKDEQLKGRILRAARAMPEPFTSATLSDQPGIDADARAVGKILDDLNWPCRDGLSQGVRVWLPPKK